jgi:hypothetical protein
MELVLDFKKHGLPDSATYKVLKFPVASEVVIEQGITRFYVASEVDIG